MEIGDWLLEEMEKRGWTQAELARRAEIADATLSRIISGTRQAGPEAALSIARALGESPITVYRLAGLLPAIPQERLDQFSYIAETLASLPDGPIRDEAMANIRAIAENARRRALEQQRQEVP